MLLVNFLILTEKTLFTFFVQFVIRHRTKQVKMAHILSEKSVIFREIQRMTLRFFIQANYFIYGLILTVTSHIYTMREVTVEKIIQIQK